MNILYRTIYKVDRSGGVAYGMIYSLYDTNLFPFESPDEFSREMVEELLTSKDISIHHHGRADVNGEVKGRADGSVSFELSIDSKEIMGQHNSVGLKGFLEWVACEGGQVKANSLVPGIFDGEYKGVRFRYFSKEGWVSVKSSDCPPEKGIDCRSIQEFYDAVEYSLTVKSSLNEDGLEDAIEKLVFENNLSPPSR